MLYFSKLKIILIYFFILTISLITVGNFLDKDFNFIDKKINLGLDLQGGSYLLLEVDSEPLIEQKLQNKLLSIKKYKTATFKLSGASSISTIPFFRDNY